MLENLLYALHPVWQKIGYERVEKPIAFVEKQVKSLLFDCQMCGQCVLHETGMSCPMNCPKTLRNGPCGGVRPNGHCEVKPEMRCVWVEAWRGEKIINIDKIDANSRESILNVQIAIDHRLQGSSSWLREIRQKRDEKQSIVEIP
jgi:hypothetical protein